MKKLKIILLIILAIIITSIFWNIPRIKYDVDRNGKITLKDAVEVAQYYLKGKDKHGKRN